MKHEEHEGHEEKKGVKMKERTKVLVLVIVTMLTIIAIKATPDWRDFESDPNSYLTADPNWSFWASDSNNFAINMRIWEPPVYNCPVHGEVDEVITFLSNRHACVECFFDIFPPLEKVVKKSK